MQNSILAGVIVFFSLAATGQALAGGHTEGGHKQIGQFSGFEGNEEVLGEAVVAAIHEAAKANSLDLDFAGRERQVGLATSKMIKTMNSNSAYQHEMNDALVKQALEFIQYAKNEGNLPEVARKDAMTQFPMLRRVKTIIEKTGNKELALTAITDQTTCFFQLVGAVERSPGMVTYRAPYGNVLTQTARMGMHDLTEQEIHDQWTKPHIEVWSEVMGVEMQISDWQEDGMITLFIPELTEAMAANVKD
jgi:hypothetical protein